MKKKRIAVVAGGYSSEAVVSLRSADGIIAFLDPDRFEARKVLICRDRWTVVLPDGSETPVDRNDFTFHADGQRHAFDLAYITIHGAPGENGLLQGYFDMTGIPYTGCSALTSALTFDKFCCKKFLEAYRVDSAPAALLHSIEELDGRRAEIDSLGLPVFVKPNDGGSSFGTTKVTCADRLREAVEAALAEGDAAIIESFMQGTEITCGCVVTKRGTRVFPVTEVVSKNEFFDYEAKYTADRVQEITPARISPELTKQVQALTLDIYRWIGASGIIRVDYIISDGRPRLLEVNTTPGMTATSFIPQQVRAAGLDMRDLLTEIIEDKLN